ncbi:MAG TPA: DUF3866 family protein [Solirubrobacteraceae bacterium]|jgi:hypothetical protein|nr:DUF3866 family protein [Solirubrobacteraceae bacterium]
MLKLRRAIVIDVSAPEGAASREQRLQIELVPHDGAQADGGEVREALADLALVGVARPGDEVIVNVEARDLGLGSGGFDIVHVNITRGLDGGGASARNVMKLNYTSLQHTVEPVETVGAKPLEVPLGRSVAVLALHGQLAPVAWAYKQRNPAGRLGYVQTEGGALPGGHSRTVAELRRAQLLDGHITAGAAHGGELEAVSTAGAVHHGIAALGWDAAVVGPGPGIIGSSSRLGHGGMAALDSAHVALALGCPTLIVARMSSGDGRDRHRGISHHTLTVLELLLEPVTVALPAGMRSPVGDDLRAGLGAMFGAGAGKRPSLALEVERPVRITRHDWRRAEVDLPAYAASGLPAETMGRTLAQDPLFFGAALAGGAALAELAPFEEVETGPALHAGSGGTGPALDAGAGDGESEVA